MEDLGIKFYEILFEKWHLNSDYNQLGAGDEDKIINDLIKAINENKRNSTVSLPS